MKELFEMYSIEQVLIFIVMLAIAAKGAVSWIDWAKEKYQGKLRQSKANDKTLETLNTLLENNKEINEKIAHISSQINLLTQSDKDDIKAYITKEHHYFCYELGYIDDYNFDCIERRYSHYKEEGGNSYVADLMAEIEALPKKPVVEKDK